MSDLRLKSSLTMDEIENNFKDTDFFSGIMEGLEEALAHKNGKASAETIERKRSLPTVNVAAIRSSLSMTQKAFAEILGVSCRTVEAWECGKSTPETPTHTPAAPTPPSVMVLSHTSHHEKMLENAHRVTGPIDEHVGSFSSCSDLKRVMLQWH